MSRYVFVSDIHGHYDALIAALASVNFNKEVDTIVSLGDPFDRGLASKEVVEFLVSCPHRYFIWGNHDIRFRDLVVDPLQFSYYDRQNGVIQTIISFDNNFDGNWIDALSRCRNNSALQIYFTEAVYGLEWKDLIAVHAWLPHQGNDLIPLDQANKQDWYVATWSHTENCIENKLFPNKKMIIGHWHAWRLRGINPNTPNNQIDFGIYETDRYIAIDACTNTSNKVNVYVYETDEEPNIIVPARTR